MNSYIYKAEDYSGRELTVKIGKSSFNSALGRGRFKTHNGVTDVVLDDCRYVVYELSDSFYYCEEMGFSRDSDRHPVIAALKMAHFTR